MRSTDRRLRRAGAALSGPVIAFVAIVFAMTGPANAAGLSAKSRDAAAISRIAAIEGAVRVIVSLDRSGGGASTLQRLGEAARRVEVGRRAERFLERFAAGRPDIRRAARAAETLPLVAMRVAPTDLARLAADPGVARVWLDRRARPLLDDTTALIGMPTTWSAGGAGAKTIVAVLDTGVDKTHPFLAGRVVDEACFSTTEPKGATRSVTLCPSGAESATGPGSGVNCDPETRGSACRHGTHVAGIAAGQNPAGTAPAFGVAPEAEIFSVQVFSYFPDSHDVLSWSSDQILALDHIYSRRDAFPGKRIAAVNLSFGAGNFEEPCFDDPLRPAIQQLTDAGIAVVAASGNDALLTGMATPACVPEAVSVSSTTKDDAISGFSNVSAYTTLFAPGSEIRSSVPGGDYAVLSGTSMAAPHVSGAFAALESLHPGRTRAEVLKALIDTGKPIYDVSGAIPRIQVNEACAALSDASLAVTASPATTAWGEKVDIVATVAATGLAPVGTITVRTGAVFLGTAKVVDGTATLSTTTIPVGERTLTVSYSGSANCGGTTVATAVHTVTPAKTLARVAAAPAPAVQGRPLTLVATIASAAGTPGGSVVFRNGPRILGSAPLIGGRARLAVTLGPGSHDITARYQGTQGFASAQAKPVTVLVRRLVAGTAAGEPLSGDAGPDALLGAGGDDRLWGGAGSDLIDGGAGRDSLLGGGGPDDLAGGGGADVIAGGPGADRFILRAPGESPVRTPDRIVDFKVAEGDRIVLAPMDSNTALPGNQAFRYIGARPFGRRAGEVRFASGLLAGDVNGDGRADFAVRIAVTGVFSAASLVP